MTQTFRAQWSGLRAGKNFDAVRDLIERFMVSCAPKLEVEFVPCDELENYREALENIVEHWSSGIPNPEWMGILAEEALEKFKRKPERPIAAQGDKNG